ncbi:MAG: histidine kinase [Rivularia sp. (in: cyanobacteria)]
MKKELRNKIICIQISFILLSCFSIAILLWLVNVASPNKKANDIEYYWQNAVDVVPEPLLTKAVSFFSKTKVDKKSIKVLKIPFPGAGELFVFDYRSPQLCGIGGCLYEIYHSEGEHLLEIIASPNLPPSQQLIKVEDSTNKAFPCITFTQKTTMNSMVSLNKYCFDAGRYMRFNEAWTTIEQKTEK